MTRQSKMPAVPNRRAKATVDIIDAVLDGMRRLLLVATIAVVAGCGGGTSQG